MNLGRVPIPVAFEDLTTVGLILAGLVVVPALLTLILAALANKKAAKGTKSLLKPFISGLISGLLLSLTVGVVGYTAIPYLKQKEAYEAVSDYYNTNIAVDGSRLPVRLLEEDKTIEPTPVTVYRVPGGNSEECIVYGSTEIEYLLYCNDKEFTH